MQTLITTTPSGELVTTSLDIAAGTGVQHKNVLDLVRRYQSDIEKFGVIIFKSIDNKGGSPTRFATLNQKQACALITYMRNNQVVRTFKLRLVDLFHKALSGEVDISTSISADKVSLVSVDYGRSPEKVYGWLYGVVYDNGTVKVGRSHVSPENRIKDHTSAGARFGLEVIASKIVGVHDTDVEGRESNVIRRIRNRSSRITGREWFKFDSTDEALKYTLKILDDEERQSVRHKPTNKESESIELALKKTMDKMMAKALSVGEGEVETM